MTTTVDAAAEAAKFRQEISAELAQLPERLVLVGVLVAERGPSATYAEYAQRACQELGVDYHLRRATRLDVEDVIREANEDAGVHGIMVYYPIFGTEQDVYLRDAVDPNKDFEGLHSFWVRCLYQNRRFIDPQRTKKAILPCTPLAIMKLIEAAGAFRPGDRPLEGRTACVFNRSEVVGRPLASMLAHDGARVYSFDIDGPLLFSPPGTTEGAHHVSETDIDRARALAEADIVVTGVPSQNFNLIRASEIRDGAVCINFSTYRNFDSNILGKASAFAPRVGPMTVVMAIRNAVRLYRNTRG
ncbi:MAG TPA: bifunctional methylenetetrahydrofolate dehydrogenase/methenyltetrahydrofolate cyclohydrolase [Polyangiales bacterium]|nr:bifunctional methylenetetrahydrofolate dehydrogenase/methenyltetrahydrofolate cyclohydrolase [Polyangiales bacterium]